MIVKQWGATYFANGAEAVVEINARDVSCGLGADVQLIKGKRQNQPLPPINACDLETVKLSFKTTLLCLGGKLDGSVSSRPRPTGYRQSVELTISSRW